MVNTLATGDEQRFPEEEKNYTATVIPLRNHLLGDTRRLLLFGAAALVVLIACSNLANMLLARGVLRSKELAMRAALGAGRSWLLRQGVVEPALLGFGGALGRWD